MSWTKLLRVSVKAYITSRFLKGDSWGLPPYRLRLTFIGTSSTRGCKELLSRIQRRTEICSGQPLPCIWKAYQKNTESHYSLTTEINFPSKTEVVSFIKWLDLERKALLVVVKLSPICTEQKQALGAMRRDLPPSWHP